MASQWQAARDKGMRHGTSNGSACAVTMSPSGHKYSYQLLLPTTALYQDLCQPAVMLSSLSLSFTHTHTHSPFQIPLCYCKLLTTPFLQTPEVLALKYIFACPFCFSIIQLQKARAETCHHCLQHIINLVIHLQHFVSSNSKI